MQQEKLAWLFFGIVVCVPVAWMIVIYRRQHFSVTQFGLWTLANIVVRVLWRTKLSYFPDSARESAVIICNHRSSVDPFFLQVFVGRPMHWMVAREFYEHHAFRWFLKQTEAIPVNRGGVDTASTKSAIRLAAAGGVVGMFPEGRINLTDEFMLPVRPGALTVALKARVPIVPCYIEGAPYAGTAWSPFFLTARTRVTFGEPVDLSPYFEQDHDKVWSGAKMLEIVAKIAELADEPPDQLRLAGKNWKPTEQDLQAFAETRRN
ncbi:MAG TPA: lysophospholipid acyltransferase family protein [Pirellulaceae bacterium]|nr:lysophospholipid acyltransferase family protein [Pirellulaceae bacterium]